MKMRIINNNGTIKILCSDGTIILNPSHDSFIAAVIQFHKPDDIHGNNDDRWDGEYPEMSMYPGRSMAFVTDMLQLVIDDSAILVQLSAVDNIMDGMLTVAEYSNSVSIGQEQLKKYCKQGRMNGALKKGNLWLIPTNCPIPEDKRTKLVRNNPNTN